MATTAQLKKPKKHSGTWTLFGLVLFLCAAAVVFPIVVIRPFVHQATLPLNMALLAQRWAPWVTITGFLIGVVVATRSWTHSGERLVILKNVLLLAGVICLGLCAWAARVNIYEKLMFRPLGSVRLLPAPQATVRPEDMVIVVSINGDDRAYPVLQMAYHHVVNDVVGGIPILPTY